MEAALGEHHAGRFVTGFACRRRFEFRERVGADRHHQLSNRPRPRTVRS
jgi:hypothetical protein